MSSVQIYLEFQKEGIDGRLVLTVHDELVYEVRNDQLLKAARIIHDTMRGIAEYFLQMPVPIDQYINDRWYEFDAYCKFIGVPEEEGPAYQAKHLETLGITYEEFIGISRDYKSAVPSAQAKEVSSGVATQTQ